MFINKKKLSYYIGAAVACFIIIIISINLYIAYYVKGAIFYDVNDIKDTKVGLVLGASVKGNRTPSDTLKNRLIIALKAYNEGKIQKIILSGDNSINYYNEPIAMQNFLIKAGVRKKDLYLDYAGFDTYDSIYRARDIFGVKKMVIFTQEYHLKRALYISNRLGIESYGVSSDLVECGFSKYTPLREFGARVKAFLEAGIIKPKPKFLGDKITIIFDTKEEIEFRKISKNVELKKDNSLQKFVNNKVSFIDLQYIPDDLVEFKGDFLDDAKGYGKLREDAMVSLENMSKDFYLYFNENIAVFSSYRSYNYQKGIKNRGCSDALCAKAGFSEHQTGLAVDLWEASSSEQFLSNIKYEKYFKWLNQNAYRYGFHNTYSKGLEIDGYEIEPWHWRFLGVNLATYLYKNNITFAEFHNLQK